MGQKATKTKARPHGDTTHQSARTIAHGGSNTPRKHHRIRREETTQQAVSGALSAIITTTVVETSGMQKPVGHQVSTLKPSALEKVQEQDASSSSTSTASVPFLFMPLTEDEATVPGRSECSNQLDGLKSQTVSTSMTGFLYNDAPTTCKGACLQQAQKVEMVDVKTSTPQMSPCFCPDTIFYHKNQHVGSETRHAEFKRGGVIFDHRSFRTLIGRYLCAFLNTEGGVIYFGVTDDGKVVGVKVDQKMEDELRLCIDTVISCIVPNVPTTAYAINFANIMNDQGQFERDLKVMEVCVHPRNPPRTMHSFDGNTYIRRDGSLRAI